MDLQPTDRMRRKVEKMTIVAVRMGMLLHVSYPFGIEHDATS